MRRSALWLSLGSAVSIVFSIALSQILLGLALLALLTSAQPLRFPPIKLPLGLFFSYTVLAVSLSGHVASGWPQIRKFFVWGIALVIASTFRSVGHARLLCLLWALAGCLSAALGMAQFVRRFQEARAQGWGGYGFYLDSRLTGFASHWMTYGGELMVIFLLALSFVLFSEPTKWRLCAALSLPVLWIGLVFGLTRSIFLLGVPLGMVYLLWNRTRWLALLIPGCAVLILFFAPFQVRERLVSVTRPHGTVDSNSRRVIMARTGLAMIKAHPWFGVGPEQVGPQFSQYVPKDIPRSLPKGWYGHLHNVYLQYAAERGIPALLLIVWLLARTIRDLHSAARRHAGNPSSWPLYGSVAVIISILAEGFFEYNLGDSEVLTMFLATVACAYVVRWQLEGAARPSQLDANAALAANTPSQHAVEVIAAACAQSSIHS